MKTWLCTCLLLSGLTGCKKDAVEPPATLMGQTWSLQSEVVVTTPINGGTPTSSVRPISAGSFTYSYKSDGTFIITGFGQLFSSGTYLYSGTTLTLSSSVLNGPPPRVLTVTELSAHKLVTVENGADASNRYTDTVISTR